MHCAMAEQSAAMTTALMCWQPIVSRMLAPIHAAVAAPMAGPTAVQMYARTWPTRVALEPAARSSTAAAMSSHCLHSPGGQRTRRLRM
eukprot:7386899-Prymnesium_polylepis.1